VGESCIWKEEFEDNKGVVRIYKSKTDIKHNGQMKTDKKTNNDLQNTTQKPRKAWRYQMGKQNPSIEDQGQNIQWPKEIEQTMMEKSQRRRSKVFRY